MKVVGYLEETDSILLTKLATYNIDVLPLGNCADNYGKYIGTLTKSDDVGVVVGYVLKVLPVYWQLLPPKAILFSFMINKIPVLLIASEEYIKVAKKLLTKVKVI